MTTWDVVVIVGAVAAIAWVNWYFFLAAPGGARPGGKPPQGAPSGEGPGDPGP